MGTSAFNNLLSSHQTDNDRRNNTVNGARNLTEDQVKEAMKVNKGQFDNRAGDKRKRKTKGSKADPEAEEGKGAEGAQAEKVEDESAPAPGRRQQSEKRVPQPQRYAGKYYQYADKHLPIRSSPTQSANDGEEDAPLEAADNTDAPNDEDDDPTRYPPAFQTLLGLDRTLNHHSDDEDDNNGVSRPPTKKPRRHSPSPAEPEQEPSNPPDSDSSSDSSCESDEDSNEVSDKEKGKQKDEAAAASSSSSSDDFILDPFPFSDSPHSFANNSTAQNVEDAEIMQEAFADTVSIVDPDEGGAKESCLVMEVDFSMDRPGLDGQRQGKGDEGKEEELDEWGNPILHWDHE